MDKKDKQKELVPKMSDDVRKGHHCNWLRVTGGAYEFILDFGETMPDREIVDIKSRLLVHPLALKNFHALVGGLLQKHEEQFGKIPDSAQGAPTVNIIVDTTIKN